MCMLCASSYRSMTVSEAIRLQNIHKKIGYTAATSQASAYKRMGTAEPHHPTTTTTTVALEGDTMDWEPARVAQGGVRKSSPRPRSPRPTTSGKRAKWVTKEELEKRRVNKQCMRCGDPNHWAKQCPHKPAKNPNRVQAASVSAGGQATQLKAQVEEDSDSSQGKE